jgi:hypothetical protein
MGAHGSTTTTASRSQHQILPSSRKPISLAGGLGVMASGGALAGKKSPPPISPSASRPHGADAEICHLHSSSSAKKIYGKQPPAGEVLGEPHASGEIRGVPLPPPASGVRGQSPSSDEVHGVPLPPTASGVCGQSPGSGEVRGMPDGSEFEQKKIAKKVQGSDFNPTVLVRPTTYVSVLTKKQSLDLGFCN